MLSGITGELDPERSVDLASVRTTEENQAMCELSGLETDRQALMADVKSQSSFDRLELFRWSACAAVSLVAHGLIALAVSVRSDEPDPEAGASVIMIDLAPIPSAPSAPRDDIAPGPQQLDNESQERMKQELQREPQPDEPRVLVVTSSADSVVAMPPPAPKLAEQPTENKAEQEPSRASPVPTAPPIAMAPAERPASPAPGRVVGPTSAALASWDRLLTAHLERYRRYPPRARGDWGIANVALTIDRHGNVVTSRIVRSSGSSILDDAALSLIRRAEPLPPPPGNLADDDLAFVVPIRYPAPGQH